MSERLSFKIGGVTVDFIGYWPLWNQRTFYLGSGPQTVQWVYSVSSGSSGSGGYVDEVSYTPGATEPFVTSQPLSQSQAPGCDATFTVSAGGTPPHQYQWRFNGTDIPDATASSFTVTNVQSANLGFYSVFITNSAGSTNSSNASLEFGQLTSWGSTYSGATTPPPGATNLLAVTGGNYFNVALRADGTVLAWGDNHQGSTNVPANLTGVIAIDSGVAHTLALKADGTVTAWGGNDFGQTNVPTGLIDVVAIAAGAVQSLALKSNGTVAVWGNTINPPADLTNAVAIAAGEYWSMALRADGTVTSWGSQSPPSPLSNVVAIAAGAGHSLALLSNGTVLGWGQNEYGQATTPAGLTNVVAIDAGAGHSLALLANGTVVAWGYSSYGLTNVPTRLTNVVALAAGRFHNLALVGSGPPVLSFPATNPTVSGNTFSLSFPSQSGRVYALEYKYSLADANWTALPLVAGTGRELVLSDPTATNPHRFYRVRRW